MADARLLFLLSNDYGELSNALYVLGGTGLDATLLLPERLFDTNRDTLAVHARRYRTLDDVIEALDSARPDIVFLFSAYLYGINGIFELPMVEALLDELQRRHLRVVTSDPFLGLLLAHGTSPFSERHPQQQWLTDHFTQLAARLRDVTHLYLVPPDGLAGSRKVSMFNPHILSDAASRQQRGVRLADRIAVDPQRARWLFLLASEDYGAQIARLGREQFEALLLDRLEDAAHAGRQPLLIAPQPCVESLSRAHRAIPGLILLSFCAHEMFTDLLLEAEYAFYWNMLSNSLLARLANRLPVFFFDRGHLAHAMPALLELGLKTYFSGAQLAVLDQRRQLVPAALGALAAGQNLRLGSATENFLRSPLPRELVQRLLSDGGRAT
jgi:hypothetical protein